MMKANKLTKAEMFNELLNFATGKNMTETAAFLATKFEHEKVRDEYKRFLSGERKASDVVELFFHDVFTNTSRSKKAAKLWEDYTGARSQMTK